MLISKEKYDELKSKEDLTDEEKQQIADFEAVEFEEEQEEQEETPSEDPVIQDDKKFKKVVEEREKQGEEAEEELTPPEEVETEDKKSNLLLYGGIALVVGGVLAYTLTRNDEQAEKGGDVSQPENVSNNAPNGFKNDFLS